LLPPRNFKMALHLRLKSRVFISAGDEPLQIIGCRRLHCMGSPNHAIRSSFLLLAMVPTILLIAVLVSASFRVTESAALAMRAREDRLLAAISQKTPIPIKTSGSGFSRTSRVRLRPNSAAAPAHEHSRSADRSLGPGHPRARPASFSFKLLALICHDRSKSALSRCSISRVEPWLVTREVGIDQAGNAASGP